MPAIDRRKLVLDAAAKSFSLFGYKATTMDQVAKIANVGKGTIYTFFANKEELFDEILRSVLAEMTEVVLREIKEDQTFFDKLYKGLDVLLDFRSEHGLLVKLAQEVREFGTVQAQEAMQRVENVILDYIERQVVYAVQQGEMISVDPKIVSFIMLKLYIALSLDWSKQHDPLDKESIKQYFRIILGEGFTLRA
ncbi:TetR/AcrR family transcriptional regulator [Paenibacillus physcomitrellae]|uniref:TetR family transcriptional regulator n=1 Tax=Paenibacillus physcomitrellae TaxID=1619311 RepID=A0ABQ1FSG6_9BACL|nr:TetR/AcrR family transcriptional regulator [Paenibacillus physcomitrellae]GGA27453.1 TetR family transcriptional regulator [Paenibacillus physcomitrellae]